MTSDTLAGSLPPYLEGTLLLRGKPRLYWSAALIIGQFVVGLTLQSVLGQYSNAIVAPVVFVLAWMWGRLPGTLLACALMGVNAVAISRMDLANAGAETLVLDGVAITAAAFVIGHVALALERALGARARTAKAYDELEAAARERMLSITDQVPIGLYRTTPDGRVIGGNDALVHMLGFRDRKEMMAANVWDHYVNAEDRVNELNRSNAGEQVWTEFPLRRVDGSHIWVRDWAVAVRDEEGQPEYYDGVLEDISDSRLANELSRAAFENSPYGMAISTTDGVLIRGNAALASQLGHDLETLTNIHYSQFTFEEDMDITPHALDKAIAGETVRYEKRLRRPDGSFFWALLSLAPIDVVTSPRLFISHVIDITERQQVREGLENLVRSKDELIASVSHELRTPLTVVRGLAEELDSNWASFSVPEQREFISMIAGQSAEVAHIVEDLLVAARADIGKLPINPSTLDLSAELEAALSSIPEHPALVETDSGSAVAFADPSRVRQIVRNLLTNASRYGGPNVRARTGATANVAWLEVMDDGAGISSTDIQKVFQPYERAHDTAGQPMSVGLGLTVSRTLAEMMGGSLEYRFEAGWSIFRLELPVSGTVHAARITDGLN